MQSGKLNKGVCTTNGIFIPDFSVLKDNFCFTLLSTNGALHHQYMMKNQLMCLPLHCHSLFVLFLSVWSVGNAACRLRDPHQGPPPSSGLQHPSVPQG